MVDESRMHSGSQPIEFAIVPFGQHPTAQALIRFLVFFAVIGCISIGGVYVGGVLSTNGAIFFIAAGSAALAFWVWRFWREFRGSAIIDDEQLVLKTGGGTDSYKWSDVRGMRLVSFADLGLLSVITARLSRIDVQRRFVEITLARRPRLSLTNRMSTDVTVGIPRLSRRLYLYLSSPEQFLSDAEALIGSSPRHHR